VHINSNLANLATGQGLGFDFAGSHKTANQSTQRCFKTVVWKGFELLLLEAPYMLDKQ